MVTRPTDERIALAVAALEYAIRNNDVFHWSAQQRAVAKAMVAVLYWVAGEPSKFGKLIEELEELINREPSEEEQAHNE